MVEMKHTKFVIKEIKRKIFGDPKPTAVKIPLYAEKQIKVEKPQESNFELPSFGGPSSIASLAVAAVVGLMVLTVFGQVYTSLNTSAFSSTTTNLINLIPLVLVGAVIIGILMMVLTLSR